MIHNLLFTHGSLQAGKCADDSQTPLDFAVADLIETPPLHGDPPQLILSFRLLTDNTALLQIQFAMCSSIGIFLQWRMHRDDLVLCIWS